MMRTGLALVVIIVAAGCGPGAENKPTVKIGTVLSTTGDLAGIGTAQLEAAALAVEQINAAGGVLDGRKLELVSRDDGTDTAKGKTAAQALVAAEVPVVIGAVGSAISLAVHEDLATAGVVQISASSTSPLLTTADTTGLLFRTCASDALQGKLLAKRAKAKGYDDVAVIHIPGAYGVGLANQFKDSFVAGGGRITGGKVYEYTEAQTSYAALLNTIYGAGAVDAILLVAYPVDGAQIIEDYLASHANKNTFWLFTDAVQDAAFVTAVGGGNFTFQHEGTGPSTPLGATYDAFKNAFTARYGTAPAPGTFGVNAYDAVYLAALAIEAGNSAESASIKANLGAVSAGGASYGPGEFRAAADAAATADIDFSGASGAVDFDANGDVVAPYDIWKVSGGAITTAEAGVSP